MVHLPQDAIGVKKEFKRIDLGTSLYVEFKERYNRWHKNKIKTIPNDIQLTPITLANWYMGDGCLDVQKIGALGQKYYRITLCTECFNLNEHQQLQRQLNRKYGWETYIQKFRETQRLRLCKKQDVIEFLKITYPFHSKCFKYKWRALFDKDFTEKKYKINICEICKNEFKTQIFHYEQKYCSKKCYNIKNKLWMRNYRKNKKIEG